METSGILSTSLHGIILAQAYGLPSRWCIISKSTSGQVPGDGMKFYDYFLSVGVRNHEPLDLSQIDVITDDLLNECHEAPDTTGLNSGLLDSAPFKVNI